MMLHFVLWLLGIGGAELRRRVRYELSELGSSEGVPGSRVYATHFIGGPKNGGTLGVSGEGRFCHLMMLTSDGMPATALYERQWNSAYPEDAIALYLGVMGPSVPSEYWPSSE